MVVTNIFILLVILMVGILSFHKDVQGMISRAVKTPVFTLQSGSNSVGLEIAIGEGADFERCAAILKEQNADASIFISPSLYKDHGDYFEKADETGLFGGYYESSEQDEDMDMVAADDSVVLKDDAWDTGVFAPRRRPELCWTMDANKAFETMDLKSISEKIYDGCIILYRYENDDEQLKKLIRIIREKGYNITEVNNTVQ
jgi:hypothetical protein